MDRKGVRVKQFRSCATQNGKIVVTTASTLRRRTDSSLARKRASLAGIRCRLTSSAWLGDAGSFAVPLHRGCLPNDDATADRLRLRTRGLPSAGRGSTTKTMRRSFSR